MFSERDAGARFAPVGTFEHEWCQKWKQLEEMKRTQLESLEKQFKEAEDKLETDMVQAVADYEAEVNRRGIVPYYSACIKSLKEKPENGKKTDIRKKYQSLIRTWNPTSHPHSWLEEETLGNNGHVLPDFRSQLLRDGG